MEMEVEFRIPTADTIASRRVWTVANEQAGLRITTGWDTILRELPPPALDRATREAAAVALVFGALPLRRVDAQEATCVSFFADGRRVDPDSSAMDQLRRRIDRLLPTSTCPPPASSMFARIDSVGRRLPPPPSARNSDLIDVGRLIVWNANTVTAHIRTGWPTGGTIFWCQAERGVPTERWIARCIAVASWMS
jgi:hypothetical protein